MLGDCRPLDQKKARMAIACVPDETLPTSLLGLSPLHVGRGLVVLRKRDALEAGFLPWEGNVHPFSLSPFGLGFGGGHVDNVGLIECTLGSKKRRWGRRQLRSAQVSQELAFEIQKESS